MALRLLAMGQSNYPDGFRVRLPSDNYMLLLASVGRGNDCQKVRVR